MELSRSTDIHLQPRPAGCPVPLVALQRYQWDRIVKRGTSLSDFRMCATSIRLSGLLDVSFLQKSIESVVQRHESLRTKIATVGGVPLQQIETELHDYFEFADLTNIPPTQREREAVRLSQEFMGKKIDIFVGPLFEAKLLKLSDQDHVLIIGLDHLVSDAASYRILNREILSLYRHCVHDRSFSLPPLPIQFPDYAIWEKNTYDSWLKEHEPYWRQRLSGAPRIRLTPDKDLPETEHPVFARLHFPFGKTLSTKLHEIAQREQMRLPLVVLTTYVAVMSRWCDQRDLVLAFVSHGRSGHPDLKNMIGLLAHVLYFRIEIGNNDSFLDVLKKVHLESNSAHLHRDFGRLLELIPGFTDLHFNWLPARETIGHQREDDRAVKARSFPFKVESPAPNVLPLFADTASGINVTVRYRSDVFTQNTIERFGQSLRRASEEFAQNPLARVDSVALAQ